MSPSSGWAGRRFATAALTAVLLTGGCLYDSTGPEALLTKEELRLLFSELTNWIRNPVRDSTFLGRQLSAECMTISFGDLDRARSDEAMIAFTYRAIPLDCEVWNWAGPDIQYSGAPEIAGDAQLTRAEVMPFFVRYTGQGAFRYRTVDGRKGQCAIDLAYGFEGGGTGPQDDRWVWEGTGCGMNMDTVLTRTDF